MDTERLDEIVSCRKNNEESTSILYVAKSLTFLPIRSSLKKTALKHNIHTFRNQHIHFKMNKFI